MRIGMRVAVARGWSGEKQGYSTVQYGTVQKEAQPWPSMHVGEGGRLGESPCPCLALPSISSPPHQRSTRTIGDRYGCQVKLACHSRADQRPVPLVCSRFWRVHW